MAAASRQQRDDMDKAGGQSVIHRKAQVARDGFDAREMSPAKALRLGLARAGKALHELALRVRTIEHETLPPDAIEQAAGDDGLLIVLDGTEGARGAVKLDLSFIAGLIEVQLMGSVRRTDPRARAFTPTDAAITEPLLNALLDNAEQELAEAGLPPLAHGLRFGDRIEDGRTLALALSAPEHDLYRLTVDMDRGARTATLSLILPRMPAPHSGDEEAGGASLQARLEQTALNAPVMLDAVLGGRMRLPLNRICAWTPGTLIPLDPEALTAAQLTAAKGHKVARVRLGQMNGFRAVRLLPAATSPSGGGAGGARADGVPGAVDQGAEPGPAGALPASAAMARGDTLDTVTPDIFDRPAMDMAADMPGLQDPDAGVARALDASDTPVQTDP